MEGTQETLTPQTWDSTGYVFSLRPSEQWTSGQAGCHFGTWGSVLPVDGQLDLIGYSISARG